MKLILLGFFSLILLVVFCNCQNDQGTAGVSSSSGLTNCTTQNPRHPRHHSDLNQVKNIIDKLVEARGIPLPKGAPNVVVKDRVLGPAAASLKHNCLIINSKTIQVAKRFGEDSLDVLAMMIGHELVHFYQQGECSFTYRPTRIDSLEQEADWQGLFNAYLAGYKIKGDGETALQSRLIDSIYMNFDLKENLPAYPSLDERKAMAALTEKKIIELRTLYETANYALLHGSFQVAIECYKYLLNNLETKELHHNLGVAYASWYKQMENDSYTYPFELNTDSRLYSKVRASLKDKEVTKNRALYHFRLSRTNIMELNLLEASLAIVGSDFSLAEQRLSTVSGSQFKDKKRSLKEIIQDKQAGKSNKILSPKAREAPNPCGFQPDYLDEIHPTTHLSNGLLYFFDAKMDIAVVKYGDNRFALQRYEPDCLEHRVLNAEYTVSHSKGKFHVFTTENMIFKENDGRVVEVVWVDPGFSN